MNNQIDLSRITACGECCDNCKHREEISCKGCIETDGCCAMWMESGRCKIHACARKYNVKFCGLCPEFPCADLEKKIHWRENVVDEFATLAMRYYNQQFDNHDSRIPYYELLLEQDLDTITEYRLPDGYHFEFYKDGDRDNWIEIEKSAKEFENSEQGLSAWNRYYKGKESELENRMVFIVNDFGEKVATATAFYDINGKDKSNSAWLHWVAVKRAYQGKRLSKPLISYVLNIMKSMGYTHAKIPTQTTTWLACKIYLDFGFKPISQNAVNSYNGWCIIKTLTDHNSLDNFNAVEGLKLLNQKSLK